MEDHMQSYSSGAKDRDDTLNIPDKLLIQAFAKLDKIALGLAAGIMGGLGLFFATVILLIKGGNPVGPNLALLGQYFIGYTVTWKGSLIGLAYGGVSGFILGWFTAFLRNLFVAMYIYTVKLKSNLLTINDFLGHL
jgi:hypothetical protein